MELPAPKVIDAWSIEDLEFIARELVAGGLIAGNAVGWTLTFKGWERFDELRRGATSGRNAFMAMPFGNEQLDRLLRDFFKPAVLQMGFALKRVDDEPKAGLIDARMMVQIKASWFVIADLTHSNLGAYWEAGYATGLGKPVIYTCERSVWAEKKSHFDTNHHLHIPWDAANMAPALQDLKATIRFTIPEAKQAGRGLTRRGATLSPARPPQPGQGS